MSPKVTYSVSLESYHLYLQPQKVSKTPHTFAIHTNMPKTQKAIFGHQRALGVKCKKLNEL
jgi:hypothetical protein